MRTSVIKKHIYTLAEHHAEDAEPICAYIYDLPALVKHANAVVEVLPKNCQLFYAAKANPEEKILQALQPIVAGFEAASGGELNWLRKILPDQKLIFGGPGKLDREIIQAIKNNVELFHVESLFELKRLQRISAALNTQISILLRMNIPLENVKQTKLSMGGKPTPFGIDEAQLEEALILLKQYSNIELKGFHFHLMSHQLSRHNHLKLMALYFDTFKRWQKQYDLSLEQINVGGGIGINYEDENDIFDWPTFCRELEDLINTKKMNDTQIRFECGRFITAGCGYYCMEVLDIKQNHGDNFVIAKGGTHHFRTPAAQNHDHPFKIYRRKNPFQGVPTLKESNANIVGQLCTPKDVLAKKQLIKLLAVGDYIVFSQAGAYAWNISHQNFLMHDKPDFVFIE